MPASRRPTAPSRWTCSATLLRAAGVDDAVNLYHDLASGGPGVRGERFGIGGVWFDQFDEWSRRLRTASRPASQPATAWP